jgi:IclR family mhp operon transcriptional activator
MVRRSKSAAAEPKSESVRSLERGLSLLRAMNADPHATVTKLAAQIGVPRSTVYRLLETLVSMGYVAPSTSTEKYRLTRQVYNLSKGFQDETWIEDSWFELMALTKTVIWPVDLLTLEAATMVVRRSTHPHSPLSIDYAMVGRRWPITQSAAGRAYLAFCPEPERELILDLPKAFPGISSAFVERGTLLKQLEQTRVQGFGTRMGGMMPRTASISTPVLIGDTVLCCISIIWMASAKLTVDRAITELGGHLKETAQRVRSIALQSRGQLTAGDIGRA